RVDHGRMRMPDDQRAPRADIVDVFRAVGVPNVRAAAAGDEPRRSTDAAIGAHGRVHAAGDGVVRALEQSIVARLHANIPENCRARASTSAAAKSAVITAMASTPADLSDAAFSGVMPPMATIGAASAAFASV